MGEIECLSSIARLFHDPLAEARAFYGKKWVAVLMAEEVERRLRRELAVQFVDESWPQWKADMLKTA